MSNPNAPRRSHQTPRSRRLQAAPLPSLATYTPQPPVTATPSNIASLPYNDQQRAANAHEALRNREQIIWLSNAKNESMAAMELQMMKMLARPAYVDGANRGAGGGGGGDGKGLGGKVLWRDLKTGDRVSEALMKRIRADEEGVGSDVEEEREVEVVEVGGGGATAETSGKEKERDVAEARRGKAKVVVDVEEDEGMDVDEESDDKGEEDEDNDDGGVRVATAAPSSGRKRHR